MIRPDDVDPEDLDAHQVETALDGREQQHAAEHAEHRAATTLQADAADDAGGEDGEDVALAGLIWTEAMRPASMMPASAARKPLIM